MKQNIRSLIAALSALAATSAFGEIKMPKIFSDGMVLQRDMPVKIWGTADANASVDVEFAGAKKSAKAGADGKWLVVLDKMPASKTPRAITVYENGNAGAKIGNVLVGEVWIAGGQSNMGWVLENTTDAKAAFERAKKNKILRYFKQSPRAIARTPQEDSPKGAMWERADVGKCALHWSAVGFYFGEKISEALDVPVGIVGTPLGATAMAAWVDEAAAGKNEYMKGVYESFKKRADKYDENAYRAALKTYEEKVAALEKENAERKKQGRPPKKLQWDYKRPNKISPVPYFRTPVWNYNAKVAPLRGLAARGIIWYQGESDTLEPAVLHFESQLKLLISAWRGYFEKPDMPFIMAQLSSFVSSPKNKWAEARAAQLAVAASVPNVYAIPTIDRGESNDIHPKDKTTVGLRMANVALSQVYGAAAPNPFAPEFKSAEYSGGTAAVSVESRGLKIESRGELRGFEVLANGKWAKADAKLDGGKIVLKSPDGADVSGVRYLWKNDPLSEICVFDSGGLPLYPFENLKK